MTEKVCIFGGECFEGFLRSGRKGQQMGRSLLGGTIRRDRRGLFEDGKNIGPTDAE